MAQYGEAQAWVDRLIAGHIAYEHATCLPWPFAIGPDGYGRFWCDGRTRQAHRLVYEQTIGPVPDGMKLDHLCHTHDAHCYWPNCSHRACVNPLHLEPVTDHENTVRARRLVATHCPKGHPYQGDNLGFERGTRLCLTCRRANNLVRYHRYAARKRPKEQS